MIRKHGTGEVLGTEKADSSTKDEAGHEGEGSEEDFVVVEED